MAKHLYLPQLDDDVNISIPNRAGHWEKKDHGIILAISDGITIAEAEKARGISSVPDIWARTLMFQTALKPDAAHPLRKRIVQEWRGLLSLLALSKIKNYPVEIVPVELGDDTFSKALKNLAPEALQLEKGKKYAWTDILMIRYDNIAIGAFSPTTLVYTATDYRERLKKKDLINILKDEYGYLCEPEHLEDLEAVGEWLCGLQNALKNIMYGDESNPDQRSVEIIYDLISEWLKDLRQKLHIEEGKDIDSKDVTVSSDLLEPLSEKAREILEKHRVYQSLLYPLQKADVGEKPYHSDMALELKEGRNRSEYKEAVIITTNLLGRNIKIWESLRLRDLGGDPQKCLDRYFDAAFGFTVDQENINKQENAVWIRPEKYFLTDTLLKAKHGSFLMDSESEYNVGTKYVLPFKKEILDFFSPEKIKEIIQPRFKEEHDGVRFTFTLPIVDGTEERIEKFYKTKEIETSNHSVLEIDVPVIEIFPNYLGENWRRYYVFHDDAARIKINPVVDDINPQIKRRIHEVVAGDSRKKVNITEIGSDNAFPEGLEIGNSKNEQEIFGLILLSRPPGPEQPDKTWRIGIDFGTSNTNVFRQNSTDPEQMAEQWQFDLQKHIRRISASEDKDRKKLLRTSFIPSDMIDLPIPTTLRIFTLARKENLLLDYFIHFPSSYQSPHNVYSDIKWDTEGEKKTELFIESLLFLLLVDIVSQRGRGIELACSYPKAFSETDIAVFEGDWERVLKKMLDSQDCVLKKYRGAEDDFDKLRASERPFYEIEGIASGEYFASEKTIPSIDERANKSIAAICLDVGGGTTDISIWYGDHIVSDASILLAGRQISQFIRKNERVRELLFSREAAVALDEKKNEPAFFAARLNVILKNEESKIQEMLLTHANKSDIQWLRKMLAIEFCAISFYTAMLTAATDRMIGGDLEKKLGLLYRIATAEIGLHWGGNAAKFINWINFGKYDKKGIASKMLSAAFYQCLRLEFG